MGYTLKNVKKNIFGDLLLWQGKPLMKYKGGAVNGDDANS